MKFCKTFMNSANTLNNIRMRNSIKKKGNVNPLFFFLLLYWIMYKSSSLGRLHFKRSYKLSSRNCKLHILSKSLICLLLMASINGIVDGSRNILYRYSSWINDNRKLVGVKIMKWKICSENRRRKTNLLSIFIIFTVNLFMQIQCQISAALYSFSHEINS